MKKSTEELLELIRNTKDIKNYLDCETANISEVSLSEFLEEKLNEKGLKKGDVLRASGIEKTYFYEIFRGEKTNPGRDKVLLIAFAMKLELSETKSLLRIACCGDLYPRDKRDSIIIWCLLNRKSVIEMNILLDDAGLAPLL